LQGPHVFCRNFNRRTDRLPEIAMANVISLTICRFIRRLVASVLTLSVLAGAALGQAAESRFADVNGTRLHYLAAGKGEPIVLLHGYAQTSHMWRPLIAQLAKTNAVIAPDLRGFGQSAKLPGGYDKKTMAQDIHALAGSLGYRRVRIAGHDIGLMVAYAYAAQYPAEVDRIVLMDAFLPGVATGRKSGCCALALPFLRRDAAQTGHRPRAHLSRTLLERFCRRSEEIGFRTRPPDVRESLCAARRHAGRIRGIS